MEEFRIVKETVTVTRFHIVKADIKSAIKAVKNSQDNSEYLESCDVIWWDSDKLYEIEELPENWRKDGRLNREAIHINERLSKEKTETDLTKRASKRIMEKKKAAPKFSALKLLGLK